MRNRLALFVVAATPLWAADVTGTVSIQHPAKMKGDHAGAVIWLEGGDATTKPAGEFKIIQKDKHFEPHILVVPVGARVAFPNLDPFFHNVFSMFDGKRFDLGLYEAGSTRSAVFQRAGISYIFCNIHPEMSAVVVSVNSRHYAISTAAGKFSLAGVAPGSYKLFVWHERAQPGVAKEYPRDLTISSDDLDLGVLRLVDSGQLAVPHKNKYGRDYDPQSTGAVYK